MGTLYECLKEAKLEKYYSSFRAHGITKSEGLLQLSVHDCSAFGIHIADDKRRLVELISIVKAVHNVDRDSYSAVNRSTSSKSPRKRGRSPAYGNQQVTGGRGLSASSDVRVHDRLRPTNSSHNLSAAGAALLNLISDEESSESASDDSEEHSDYEPAVKHSVSASVSKVSQPNVKKAPSVGKVVYSSGYNYGVPGAGASSGTRPKSRGNARIHDDKIRVCVRKRPLSKKEVKSGESDLLQTASTTTLVVSEPKQAVDLTAFTLQHEFIFDEVFEESCTNEDVYIRAARPLISCVFDGGSATCFAYGQTGAGKTHTMIGSREVPGLYLLAAHDIFSIVQTGQYGSDIRVWVSFFEIYCGQLFDLLNKRNRLHAREDGSHRVCIAGLTETEAKDEQSLMQVLEYGNSVRSKGATGVNPDSSRSHAVLQMEIRDRQEKRLGRISFIDLAGSERASDSADTDKQTKKEGAEINQSLLALKECIRSIDQESRHKPFRQSKLTHILKDSFIGNSRTCMIANVSPASSSVEHTLNTLRYADRVKELRRTANTGASTSRSMNVAMSNILMNIPASGPSLFQPSNILCSSTPTRQSTRQFTNRGSTSDVHLDPSETPIRGPGVRRKTASASVKNESRTSHNVRSSVRSSSASNVTSRSAVVRHVAPNTASSENISAKQNMSSNSESDQTESDSCNNTGPQKPVNIAGSRSHQPGLHTSAGRPGNNTYTRKEASGSTNFSKNIPLVKSTDTENDFPTTDFNNEEEVNDMNNMNDLNRTDGKNNVAASTPVFPSMSDRKQSEKQSIHREFPTDSTASGQTSNKFSSVSASVPFLRKKVYTENDSESASKEPGNSSQYKTPTTQQSDRNSLTTQHVPPESATSKAPSHTDTVKTFSTAPTKTKDLENQRLKNMVNRPTLQIPDTLSSFDDDLLFDPPSVDQRLWTPRTPSESSGTQPRIPQDPTLLSEIPAVLPAKSTELTTFSQRSPRWQLNKNYTNVPSQQPSGFRQDPAKNSEKLGGVKSNENSSSEAFNTSKHSVVKEDRRGAHLIPKNRNNNAYDTPNDFSRFNDRDSNRAGSMNAKDAYFPYRGNNDRGTEEPPKQPVSANWFITPADHDTHVTQSVSRSGKPSGSQPVKDSQSSKMLDEEETDLKKMDNYSSLGSERRKSSTNNTASTSASSHNVSGKSSGLLHEQSKKSGYSSVKPDYRNSDFSKPNYFSDSAMRSRPENNAPVKHRVVHSPENSRQAFNNSPVIKDMPSSNNNHSPGLSSPSLSREDRSASPLNSQTGNGAVKTEKLTTGSMFSPIHPQPVTNGGQTKNVGAAVSKDIILHPTPVSRSSSSSETRLDRASSAESDVVDLKAQLISSHEDQLATVTSLCKQEMKLLLSAKAGNKKFEDYMKKVSDVLSQKISAIQLLQDQIMAYQLSTQDSS